MPVDTNRRISDARPVGRALGGQDRYEKEAIEGPDEAIRALYARLEQDDRHHNLRVVIEEPTSERQFAQWSMGFVPQKAIPAKDMAAFSSFLSAPADAVVPAKVAGAVRVALEVFRHHVR